MRRAARYLAISSKKSLWALKKKERRGAKLVDIQAALQRPAHVFQAIRQGEGQLLGGGGAGFADVVAGDADRVPLRDSCVPYSMVSTTRRMDGSGGKMYSFWAMYSLRMSFWMVPRSWSGRTPCFSAAAMYIAQMTAAGELMVMLAETWSRGMPSSRISISLSEETATPHLPNSPSASGASVS